MSENAEGAAAPGLAGKVVLVTGGSRGIGKAIALAMAQAGANVLITSRKAEACEQAAAEIGRGVQWLASNVGHPDDAENCVDETLSRFGRLDVLVNNAGTNPYAGPVIDVDPGRWAKTVQVNLTAPLMWTQLAWRRYMKDAGGGCSVLNIASVAGLRTSPVLGVYGVSKAALIHLSEQLAGELGPAVRVNCLAPGLVRTDFSQLLWENGGDEVVSQAYPLKRLGEPIDIARAAVFLASDGGSWITGQTLVLDGGGLVAFSGASSVK